MLTVSIGGIRVELNYRLETGLHYFTSEKFGVEASHKRRDKAYSQIIELLSGVLL